MHADDRSAQTVVRRLISARWIARTLIVVTLVIGLISCADPKKDSSAGNLTLYTTEQTAQKHCPKDTVVWLNLPTGIYHFQGQRWYANTKTGAFVCEKEADEAGDRATLNGQ
jgi:hypothetical protein